MGGPSRGLEGRVPLVSMFKKKALAYTHIYNVVVNHFLNSKYSIDVDARSTIESDGLMLSVLAIVVFDIVIVLILQFGR